MIAEKGFEELGAAARLAAKNLDQLFELEPHLMDELLALIEIDLRIVAREPVPGSANRKPLFIQQAANLANDEHVLPLVIAAVAAPLHRLQLREIPAPNSAARAA